MTDPTSSTEAPLSSYCRALGEYDQSRLGGIYERLGRFDRGLPAPSLAKAIANRLAEPREAEIRTAALSHSAKLALSLFSLFESTTRPAAAILHSLTCLGVSPREAIAEALQDGLLALARSDERSLSKSFSQLLGEQPETLVLIAHPAVVSAARTVLPEGAPIPSAGPARQVRESDGLEPIVRLAALWQRLAEDPLRQTQQGLLYKRDRDRLEEDPALSAPIADALAPLADPISLWFDLARAVGMIQNEEGSDRIVAAPADYWREHAVHLPQMIAARWMSLLFWHELHGRWEGRPFGATLPALRPVLLLWLAKQDEGEWAAIDDLSARLSALCPGWEHLDAPPPARTPKSPGKSTTRKELSPARGTLEAVLLGPAYQLGLVRSAEEVPSGRPIVQLTPLGHYVLALGPPPPSRPSFEHFLFVQPNFEIIAYRQGLNPPLIGQLSRFTRWGQLGAALELTVTPESVYRGLESGLEPGQMLERLARHSARPLPSGVAEAVRSWSNRRERLSYYSAATLMEFASADALRAVLADWPDSDASPPVQVADRLLLVENESSIPFRRFRLAGSRDYRRPPEPCVEVESDGVTLALDLGRSDLFIEAELLRFAEEERIGDFPIATRRRFRVTPASMARGIQDGLTASGFAKWFPIRTGGSMPPAMRLLLHSASPQSAPLGVSRPIVLTVPTSELLDGLTQHPRTRDYLGERLGPTTVMIPDQFRDALFAALANLGLKLEERD